MLSDMHSTGLPQYTVEAMTDSSNVTEFIDLAGNVNLDDARL